jgi:ATP-binding cassette subfamily B protein
MAEYFETEEVTKGFDPVIAKRIMGYVKPYWAMALAGVAALLLSTLGELAMPLVSQRIIDAALMPAWRRVAAAQSARVSALTGKRPEASIGAWDYYPASALRGLSGAEEKAMTASGALDPDSWYLFRLGSDAGERSTAMRELAARHESSREYGALRKAELAKLDKAQARSIRGKDLEYLSRAMVLFGLILILVLLTSFAQTYWTSLIGQRVMKDIRMELFGRTVRRSLAFISRHPVGRLVTRMSSDVETINEFFTSVVIAFMKDLSVMAGVLAALFVLDWKLALIAVCTLPPVLVATLMSRVRARDAFRRQRIWLSKVNSFISEHLSGIQVVKLFNRERASMAEFGSRNGKLLAAGMGEMYVFAVFRPLVDLFSSISSGVVIYFGASLFMSLSISLGTLIAFINLIRMFYSPVMDISEKYTLLQSAMAGGERVFALLDADERIPDEGKRPLPDPLRGHIEFDRVSFSYKQGEQVIRDLSFQVRPGELVAIVGYTGAGKTTIANLITRLWDVDSGEIRVDGVPVKEAPLDDLRRAIQPVLQEVFLFSGSVRDNISLGADMDDERVRKAARIVGADDFIMGLPEGYATKLSEGAGNISAGQRQLVSFARVVAHDPRVIILDEATSNIDTETERLIQRGLKGLLAGRTSIVIAHRLSTIQHADRILVLGHGRLLESGSHQELLEKRGLYYNLYRLQYESSLSSGS